MDNSATQAAVDTLPWWTPFVTLATPLLGFAGVWVSTRITGRNSKEATRVSRKEAETNQFSAIVEGFVEQLRAVREDLNAQRAEVDKLTTRVEQGEQREQEYLSHMALLESMVPNPPGPPVRPWLAALVAAHQ